jgi:hypothetical protein
MNHDEPGEKLNRVCKCCRQRYDNLRVHMGAHILCKMRGVEQTLKKPVSNVALASGSPHSTAQVGDSLLCGFCRESGHATIQSNCCLAETA